MLAKRVLSEYLHSDSNLSLPVVEQPTKRYIISRRVRYKIITLAKYCLCTYRLFSIVVMIAYLLLGAVLFSYVERTDPKETKLWLNETRNQFWLEFKQKSQLYDSQMMAIYDEVNKIMTKYDMEILGDNYEHYKDRPESWDFGESFSFCFIVVTTIGQCFYSL